MWLGSSFWLRDGFLRRMYFGRCSLMWRIDDINKGNLMND